jgi:hypothetical protein
LDRRDHLSETDLEWHRSNQAPFRLDTRFLTVEVPGKCARSKRARPPKLVTRSLPSPKVSTKGLLVWGGAIALSAIPLSAIVHYNWWLILVFGAVMPIALGLGNRIAPSHKAKVQPPSGIHGEKELLEVLGRHGELTPLTAATKTSLTVSEADQMLGELAQKGHLEVRVDGGKMSYALWERNRQGQSTSSSALER